MERCNFLSRFTKRAELLEGQNSHNFSRSVNCTLDVVWEASRQCGGERHIAAGPISRSLDSINLLVRTWLADVSVGLSGSTGCS